MRERTGLLRAEFLKMRHTFLIPIHFLIPLIGSGVFLAYYRISSMNEMSQAAGFLEAVGICYPFLISVICARSAELEEENHFQTFLGVSQRKEGVFWAKYFALQILSLTAMLAAVLIFAAGHRFLLGKYSIGIEKYMIIACVMWLGGLPLYLEHMFLNLRFSKAISMGISATQFLLSGLMLTGLGDGAGSYFHVHGLQEGVRHCFYFM